MTLPAFAVERSAAERRCVQHGARSAPAAIDRYRLPARRWAANPPAAVADVDQWDRQTDRQTDGRPTVTYVVFRILGWQRQ